MGILMPKLAFLFPGQASQFVGMGRDVYESFGVARRVYDRADEILDFRVTRLSFEGPEEILRQTQHTQPAVFVHSVAIMEILRDEGFQPEIAAGHSLGEYSAWVCAGAMTFSDGLGLVALRGALMQQTGQERPGGMAAVLGLEDRAVEKLCEEIAPPRVVCTANFNCPGQVVISGDAAAVREVMRRATSWGAKKVVELPVSGAFHSPLMAPAAERLKEVLDGIRISRAEIPVVANVTALPATEPVEIRSLLIRQLTHPVRWTESVRWMIEAGGAQMVEVGPGRALAGMVRRIDRTIPIASVGRAEEVLAFIKSKGSMRIDGDATCRVPCGVGGKL